MPITFLESAAPAAPSAGKVALFVDSADSVPKYVDDAGDVHTLQGGEGPAGPVGNSLARPTDSISSAAGVVTIDLSTGIEVYLLTLTENVTSWAVTNLPASGYCAEIAVVITQHASAAKTCVSPASAGRTAGADPWVMPTALGSIAPLGLRIYPDGTRELFAGGTEG